MQFEYEISSDEFVAGQILYQRLSSGTKHQKRAIGWALMGALLVIAVLIKRDINFVSIMLGMIGMWWICAGVGNFSPNRYFRRAYSVQALAGKKFHAHVDEQGFEVVGELRSWRVRWAGVPFKGEDKNIFMLFSGGTIFVFAKKYLNEEQRHEFRNLASLPTG